MSVWSLAREDPRTFRALADPDPIRAGIDRVTKWIPGDVLALFVAGVTTIAGFTADPGPRVVWLVASAAAAPLIVILIPYSSGQGKVAALTWRKALAALLAFGIWSLTIPDTAWHQWSVVASNSVLITLFMALVGIVFGLWAEGFTREPPKQP